MLKYVFISYKREDEAFALKLSQKLHDWNYSPWWDNQMIPPDSPSWADEIQHGLENSHTVIGIMTDQAMQSENVKAEWDWAIINNRRLLLLWAENCQIHHQYLRRQRIDFRDNLDKGFKRLEIALKSTKIVDESDTNDLYSEYIIRFYNRVRSLLKQSLLYALAEDEPNPITLRLDTASEYVVSAMKAKVDPMALRLGIIDKPQYTFDDFHSAFQESNRRVLLLGSPGAGKTTTLLHYALSAAVQRKQDPSAPLPVMNLITTWDGISDMATWLQNSFDAPEYLSELLSRGECLLLLDGLDELGTSRTEKAFISDNKEDVHYYDPRQRFLNIIPANNQVVVTSRISDYAQIGHKADLSNALVLHPLSDLHLKEALVRHPALLLATQQDPNLKDLMKTPLIMALFAFAYDDIPPFRKQEIENLTLAPLDVRDELVLAYIRRRYKWEELRGLQLDFKLGDFDPDLDDKVDPRPAFLLKLGQLAMEICGEWRRFGGGRIEENVLTQDDFELVFQDTPEHITPFQQLALRLNIFQYRRDNTYGFIHLYLRDALAYSFSKFRIHVKDLYGSYEQEANPLIAMGVAGKMRVVSQLGEWLKRASIDEQRVLIEAIAYTKSEEAIPYLHEMFRSDSRDIRSRTVSAMIRLGRKDAVEGILTALKDIDWRVRSSALSALADIGSGKDLQAIFESVDDPHPRVRSRAIGLLGKVESQNSEARILSKLTDADWSVRRSVVAALTPLAQSGSQSAIKAIVRALQDEDVDVRSSAIDALGQIGGDIALQGVIEALNDNDINVRHRAISELTALGTDEAQRAIDQWRTTRLETENDRLQNEDPKVRCQAIKVLGDIGRDEAIQLIMKHLNDEDVNVRRQAIRELRELRVIKAIPDLVSKLQDQTYFQDGTRQQRICDYAAYALEKIGTPEAIAAVRYWQKTR